MSFMEIPLLKDIVIIFGLSIVVLLICHRLKLPTIVGFLITGVVAGPQGFGLISRVEEVKILAEIGIVVLLFTVGLEFSIKKIFLFKRFFILAGPIQVGLTIIGGFLAGLLLDRPIGECIFLGFILSLSSTAIVMRILQERAETSTPHGQLTLGILIFQDIIAVLMMLSTPLLAGTAADFDPTHIYPILKGVVILAFTFLGAIQLVPTLLFYVAKTRSRELFLLTVFVICFSVAWITASVGLSLALGAFLAGLTISESEYSTQAIGDILPFQDIFTSFFFVSIGMLLNVEFFLEDPLAVVAVTIGIFLFKGLVVTSTALFLGLPIRTAVLSGLALSQVGEFSFVLAMSGIQHNIGTDYLHQLFLAVAVLSMGLTPTLITLSPRIASLALRIPLPQTLAQRVETPDKLEETKHDHLIIVGYGFSGRNLARAAREGEIPYIILDMNPETVREERLNGEPIFFGDATREQVLKHANIQQAKALAVVVNDPIAALRIVEHAREINRALYIIVRTRYLEEMRVLFQLGADEVIPDELGSSIEIFSRVLSRYEIPLDRIDQLVGVLRTEGYELLRPRYSEETAFSDIKEYLADIGVKTVTVKEGSPIIGKTLQETQLRKKYGLNLLIIKREGKTLYDVGAETTFQARDRLVIVGTRENLKAASEIFNPS